MFYCEFPLVEFFGAYVRYVRTDGRTDIIGTLRVPRGPKKTVIPKCKTGGYSTLSQMLSHVMVSLNICNCLCLFGGLVWSCPKPFYGIRLFANWGV